MIFDLLDKLNSDCNFTDNIKESKYVQKIKDNNESIKLNKKYKTFVECILCEFDPIQSTGEYNKLYLTNKISEICSHIEEKSDTNYSNYNFNTRSMKVQSIQRGLQLWEKENNISSIYYFNEYFKKNFTIVYENIAYITTLKSYPKIYLEFNKGIKIIPEKEFIFDDLTKLYNKIPLINDIKKDIHNIYKMHLEAASKYKIDDLKKIAIECNLSLKDSKGKNKTKAVLYDEINMLKLNI